MNFINWPQLGVNFWYNRLCPDNDIEPDSNIVEYAEDVLEIVKEMIKSNIIDK